jgi:hypothetical protein
MAYFAGGGDDASPREFWGACRIISSFVAEMSRKSLAGKTLTPEPMLNGNGRHHARPDPTSLFHWIGSRGGVGGFV